MGSMSECCRSLLAAGRDPASTVALLRCLPTVMFELFCDTVCFLGASQLSWFGNVGVCAKEAGWLPCRSVTWGCAFEGLTVAAVSWPAEAAMLAVPGAVGPADPALPVCGPAQGSSLRALCLRSHGNQREAAERKCSWRP